VRELVWIGAAPEAVAVYLGSAGWRVRLAPALDLAFAMVADGSSPSVAMLDLAIATPRAARTLRDRCEALELILVAPHDLARDALTRLGDCVSDVVAPDTSDGELALRVELAHRRHAQRLSRARYELTLEERVLSRTEEVWEKNQALKRQFLATIEALEVALESKHEYTEGHSRRVAILSVRIARELALGARMIEHVRLAALFHDIGKIGIRDNVLNKQGPLTEEEYEHIKLHPLIAEKILAPLDGFDDIIDMIKYEHERYDGKGYPYRLAGEQIPLGARIIAVADAYDALVTTRSYRKGTSIDLAIAEIRRHGGTQFDPVAVDALARVYARGDVASEQMGAAG